MRLHVISGSIDPGQWDKLSKTWLIWWLWRKEFAPNHNVTLTHSVEWITHTCRNIRTFASHSKLFVNLVPKFKLKDSKISQVFIALLKIISSQVAFVVTKLPRHYVVLCSVVPSILSLHKLVWVHVKSTSRHGSDTCSWRMVVNGCQLMRACDVFKVAECCCRDNRFAVTPAAHDAAAGNQRRTIVDFIFSCSKTYGAAIQILYCKLLTKFNLAYVVGWFDLDCLN